ncbi:MAG: zf-TFIIB domain-containing protein [Elusimicrobiota bacterium]
MLCPRCGAQRLSLTPVRKGLEIDACPSCGGVWLDKSEIYFYVSKPEQAYEEFKTAYKAAAPAEERCPRCDKAMRRAVIQGADLAFEACPGCGGNWFDSGEVQKLYGYLDSERQRKTGTGGEYLGALPGPRPLTPEELDSWAGASLAPYHAAVAAAVLTGLVVFSVEAARTPWIVALLAAVTFLAAYAALGYRRWYIRGAQVAVGEILGYAKEIGNRALVHVLFIYGEYPYQLSRVIWFKSPLDLGVGGIVQIVVHPWHPRGAFIVAPEGARHPWTEEDRLQRMSCDSILTDPSQGPTLLDLLAKPLRRRRGKWP